MKNCYSNVKKKRISAYPFKYGSPAVPYGFKAVDCVFHCLPQIFTQETQQDHIHYYNDLFSDQYLEV